MKKLFLSLTVSLPVLALAQHPLPEMSYLQVYDIETHTSQVIKEFPFTVEAPNWSPDGKWLLLNKDGRLYRMAADGSTDLEEIPTGSITHCNNDHVISADGKWIGLSSNSNQPTYNSYVYLVPVEGGEPRQITPIGPSYLHGISPDGKTMAYCAFRDDPDADIWVKPVKGGKERRLTTQPGLDDGPEYSFDGKYIWFNSVRTGRMQAWRMRANGKEQTQMTFDEDMNSWFPHISPDNQKVVYIAYHDYEIAPGDHLANRNVQLRMIPAEGGEPEILMEMFGGQGSINVNSWSPDSKRFAFVSYRLKDEIEAPQVEMNVQLYSLRSLLGTPELFAKNHDYVLRRVAQMGFSGVEAASYEDGKLSGLDPTVFRQAIEQAGLKLVSSHTTRPLTADELQSGSFQQALQWWDKCIKTHKEAGVKYLVMSWLPLLDSKHDIEVTARYIEEVGKRCREAGLSFGYHSHSQEFQQVEGTTMMDHFICNTTPENVFFEMDVYWAVVGGVSPVAYMKKYPGRFTLLHIKDQNEIGQSGMVGFEPIFRNMKAAGTKGFVVELEYASTPNILQGLRESALYLRHAPYTLKK